MNGTDSGDKPGRASNRYAPSAQLSPRELAGERDSHKAASRNPRRALIILNPQGEQ